MLAGVEGTGPVDVEEVLLQLAPVCFRGRKRWGLVDGRWRLSSRAVALWSAGVALGRYIPAGASRFMNDGCDGVGEGGLDDPQVRACFSADEQLGDAWGYVDHLTCGLGRGGVGEPQ